VIARLQRVVSSIAGQVTVVTIGALIGLIFIMLLVVQGPFAAWVYPRVLADNAETLADLVYLIESSDEATGELILQSYVSTGRSASLSPGFGDHLRTDSGHGRAFYEALPGRELKFASLGPVEMNTIGTPTQRQIFGGAYAIQVGIGLNDGRVLNVWMAPSLSLDRRPAVLTFLTLVSIFFAVSLSAAISFVVHKPIKRLEREAATVVLADAGGRVAEEGPIELRQLAAALNQMRRRLAGLISEREQIIAAIAHDVRTGLTRVRLRLDEDQTVTAGELEADLSQMEHLITDMVAYARAESPSAHRELIKMGRFLNQISSDAPTGVTFHTALDDQTEFTIAGDPVALRRLFENLIENARRYGGDELSLNVCVEDGALTVQVADNGPGIPEDQLEVVFKPFQRLETSRNRATGGTGLGLGIARSVAVAHGAALWLENRPEGGLMACVQFPADLRT
jgi:signal transduction histidine kinase